MRRPARLLTTVPVIASLAFAAAATAHAATAAPAAATAPAPHWRIVAAFPNQSSIQDIAANGPASAWAAESCRKPCASGNGVILRHWNGKTWRAEPQPANAKHAGDTAPVLAAVPGSPDVWAVYNRYGKVPLASAAEWTGKSWAHPTLFDLGTNLQTLAAARPSDVWAFGSSTEFGSVYVVRWNGKSWAQALSPGAAFGPWTAVARSASDIWAQAISGPGRTLAVSRWNGLRWVRQPVPHAPKGSAGAYGGLSGDLAVSGKDNVWSFGYFAFKPGSTVYWLQHWNGKAWSNVRVPYPLNASYIAGPLGPDGRGGAWLAATPAGASREYLYHVTAAGHWTRVPIPTLKGAKGTFIAGFAAIPGTSSVYAYGRAAIAGGQRGVILRYET